MATDSSPPSQHSDGDVGGGRSASHRGSFASSFAGYLQTRMHSGISSGTGSSCGAVGDVSRLAPTVVPSQNHPSSVAVSSAVASAFLIPVRSRISVGRSRDIPESALPAPAAKTLPSISSGASAVGACEMHARHEPTASMDAFDISPFEDNTLQRLSCAMRTLEAARAGSAHADGGGQAGSTPCVGADAAACDAIQQVDQSADAEPVLRDDVISELQGDSPAPLKEVAAERSPAVTGSGVSGTTGPPSSTTLMTFEEMPGFNFPPPLPRLGSPPTMEGAVPVPPIAASDWLTKRLRTTIHSSEPRSPTILAAPQPSPPLPPQPVSEAAPFLTAAVKSRKSRRRGVPAGDCVGGGVSSSSEDSDPEYVERWTQGILKRSEQQRIKGHWASASSSHAVASASVSAPPALEVEVAAASALATTSTSPTLKPVPKVSLLSGTSDVSTLAAGNNPTTVVDGTSTIATAELGMEGKTQDALEARTVSINSTASSREMHL